MNRLGPLTRNILGHPTRAAPLCPTRLRLRTVVRAYASSSSPSSSPDPLSPRGKRATDVESTKSGGAAPAPGAAGAKTKKRGPGEAKEKREKDKKEREKEEYRRKYKDLRFRWLTGIIAMPILLVTSYHLYDRLVLGTEKKEIPEAFRENRRGSII
ncbi:hypothetical protein N3K66_008452 [Trichothecium roseum]|uniref:Uncharacterized protein n=1 Tax=Trichothecium roseum TaxID=47278 RepID=A0ACC0URB3_9HYPO|nr:hypothetical protein N3K66_008452 [Trichothecium roseum]